MGLCAFLAASLAVLHMLASADTPDWATIGRDPENSRNQPLERTISVANVSRLAPKWIATTAGDVSATPAVVGGAVYFGDFGGTLWKLDARDGSRDLVAFGRRLHRHRRRLRAHEPALAGNTLVVGDIRHPNLLGIDAATGALRWITQVHPDPRGVMTGSPVLAGDTIYTGVSATGAGGRQATFRGAIVALDSADGPYPVAELLASRNNDAPGGYAGATMFAAPTVDLADGLVYGTFGQPYVEPESVTACHQAHGGFDESCEQPGAYFRSVVAFDLKTGEPKWSYRVQGHEPRARACGSQPPAVTWCAAETDVEKWDLGGSAPNLMRIRMNGRARTVLGVGEKSGVYLLLDAKTGAFLWNTLLGPGGDQGGMEWGTAFDGTRVYASITNQHHLPYTLTSSARARHRGILGRARPGDGKDSLADRGPSGPVGPGRPCRSRTASSTRRRWRGPAIRCSRSTRRPARSAGGSPRAAASIPGRRS